MSVIGILLAGGQSRRMGEDKATLLFNQVSMLERQRGLLDPLCNLTFVSRNEDGCIKDIYVGMGPLAGIHSCLKTALSDPEIPKVSQALIIAVDMPLLTTELLVRLLQTSKELNQNVHYGDQPFPIVISEPQRALELLEQMLEDDQRMVGTLLDKLGVVSTEVDDDHQLLNANTPLQWKLAQKQWQQDQRPAD